LFARAASAIAPTLVVAGATTVAALLLGAIGAVACLALGLVDAAAARWLLFAHLAAAGATAASVGVLTLARAGAGPDRARELEALRGADALEIALSHVDARQPVVVRRAAVRAAARILPGLAPHRLRDGAERLSAALERCRLSPDVVGDALQLLGDAAPAILPTLLGRRSPTVLRGALQAAGRCRSIALVHSVLHLASHPDAEVRAAAWRALRAIGALPPAGVDLVRGSMRDEHAFVRVHATRAACMLPASTAIEVLWGRLGDPSWWVRLAAAESLRSLGPDGEASLAHASERHPDPFARDMARHHAPAPRSAAS